MPDSDGLRRFLDEILDEYRGGLEIFEEERIDGRIARRKLRRMKVPSLVVAVRKRAANIIKVQPPSVMNDDAILFGLTSIERPTLFCRAVRGNRQDVGRTVGEPDACPCQRHLHYLAGEIGGEVRHWLMPRRDVACRCVIVRADMHTDEQSAGRA